MSLIARASGIAASAAASLLTARLLAPAERGMLALLTVPVAYVAAFAGTGMRQPFAKGAGDPSLAGGTLSIAASAGALATVAWSAARAGWGPAAFAGALCTGTIAFGFLEAMSIARGKVTRVLWAQVGTQVIFLAGTPVLQVLGWASPVAFVALQIVAFCGVAGLVYAAELRQLTTKPRVSAPVLVESTRHGASSLALTLLCRIDLLAAALLLERSALGQYAVAASLGEFLAQAPAFAGFMIFARTPQDVRNRRVLLRRLVVRTLGASVIAAAVLWYPVPHVVVLLLGESYAGAGTLFAWILPAYVLSSAIRVAAGLLAATGATNVLFIASAAGAATMLVASLSLRGRAPSGPSIAVGAACAQFVALLFAWCFTRDRETSP